MMNIKHKSGLLAVLVILILLTSGCVTSSMVKFDANVEGAEVYLDGEYIGDTPTEVRLSNGVWYEPFVRLEKEGYNTASRSVAKEIKVVNAVVGYTCIWFPSLFWSYGPKEYQYYTMYPQK